MIHDALATSWLCIFIITSAEWRKHFIQPSPANKTSGHPSTEELRITMKAALKFILSYWGLWPLLTAVFSLVVSVGLTNHWGNAALWLWLSLIIVTLITQLYVMLQYVKARKWMSAFMLLLLMVVSMMSFFLFFAIAVMSDGKGLPMQAV